MSTAEPAPSDGAATGSRSAGRIIKRWLPLAGVLLLVVLISRLDHAALLEALAEMDPVYAAVGVLVFLFNVWVKGLRWGRLLVAQRIDLPMPEAIRGFFVGAFYGSVTFGRLGELLRVEILTSRGVPLGLGLASCIFDRVLDLAMLLLMGGVFGAWWLGEERLAWTLLAVGVGAIPLVAWGMRRSVAWARTVPETVGGARRTIRELVLGSPPMLRPAPLAEALVWTALGWVGHFGAVLALSWGLGLGVSVAGIVSAGALAALSNLLPISFQGAGTRELIFSLALAREGVTGEQAVALGLCTLGLFVGTTALGGVVALRLAPRSTGTAAEG